MNHARPRNKLARRSEVEKSAVFVGLWLAGDFKRVAIKEVYGGGAEVPTLPGQFGLSGPYSAGYVRHVLSVSLSARVPNLAFERWDLSSWLGWVGLSAVDRI